jgi:hypothetical protein
MSSLGLAFCGSGFLRPRGCLTTRGAAYVLILLTCFLDHLLVPIWCPVGAYSQLLTTADSVGSTPSQSHFAMVFNRCQLGLFRPLKAVARVRC